MPIVVGTSPALATVTTGNITSPSFTPPAGSLLVVGVVGSGLLSGMSGGGLTWTRRIQRAGTAGLELWTAPGASGAGMTVTGTTDGVSAMALKVWPITGHATSPIGTTGNGTSNANNSTVNGYTSTGAGSRGFIVAAETAGLGTPSSTDDETAFVLGGELPGLMATKASNSGAAGTNVTFNLDAAGTDVAQWEWAALEILATPEETRFRPLIALQAAKRAANW